MDQKKLSVSLKAMIIVIGLCGLVIWLGILPNFGSVLHGRYPEFAAWHWPWMVFLWITALPCYAVLVLAWKIAANIGADRSFSMENARLMQGIAWLAAGCTLYFFIGNVVLFFLGMNHPAILLGSMLVCLVGIAVTVAAACLSHLVRKAAALQEQSDYTV